MGILGWSPSEFWSSTPKDLFAAITGWREANSPPAEQRSTINAPSEERMQEMLTWV